MTKTQVRRELADIKRRLQENLNRQRDHAAAVVSDREKGYSAKDGFIPRGTVARVDVSATLPSGIIVPTVVFDADFGGFKARFGKRDDALAWLNKRKREATQKSELEAAKTYAKGRVVQVMDRLERLSKDEYLGAKAKDELELALVHMNQALEVS